MNAHTVFVCMKDGNIYVCMYAYMYVFDVYMFVCLFVCMNR